MEDYLSGRQLAIDDISKDELNRLLEGMLHQLGDGWMDQQEEHPIRTLWKRKDYLATNELLNLAYAIDKIEQVNPKWLESQVKKVRSNDINNIRGAIFEIEGFSYMLNDAYTLQLASDGNPGIDGTIYFTNDVKMNISMKNYGISRFEKEFNAKMKELEAYFSQLLKKTKLLTIQCIIEFKSFPQSKDYEDVKKLLCSGLQQFPRKLSADISNDIVDITMRLLVGRRFASGFHSYVFIASAPFHKNEFKNLVDKLESACDNIIKQKKFETEKEINGIFVHLHENASIDRCQKLLQHYLNENVDKPISFIYLYCPCGARERETNTSRIVHTIKTAISTKRYQDWIKNNGVMVPNLEFFVGSCSLEKSEIKLIVDDKEGPALKDCYVYQRGEIYEEAKYRMDGSIEGNIDSIAPGIRINSVMKLSGKKIVLEGKFPVDEHLEIT